MERKIDRVLQNWFEDRDHKALVLRGPRQVGKSYAIRKFGTERYDSIIEINFEDRPDYRSIKGITNYGTIGSGDGILGLATPLLRLRFRDRL